MNEQQSLSWKDTLAEARVQWSSPDPPEKCPCCDRARSPIYKRSLYSSLVRALAYLARAHRDGIAWVHPPSYFANLDLDSKVKAGLNGVACKLFYWGLVEGKEDDRADGSKQRLYRLTPVGHLFLSGEQTVPKWVRVMDRQVIESSAEQVSVAQAAANKFSVTEILNNRE